jgi:hypothetical protein
LAQNRKVPIVLLIYTDLIPFCEVDTMITHVTHIHKSW